jgi:hypothetical protein
MGAERAHCEAITLHNPEPRTMKTESFKAYDVFLSNGDLFARLTFTKSAILAFWPDATIKRNKVFLA